MLSRTRVVFAVLTLGTLAGCGSRGNPAPIEYAMGDRVTVGPLTYNVVESTWRSQLGDAFKVRMPDQRFLMITVSVTNGGGKDVSVPLFTLQNQNGQTFTELDNGQDVDNWFGLLRELSPAQTQQGRVVFDVPLSSYRMRVTDGGEPGTEKSAWVTIPLRMDADTSVPTPLPGGASK